MPDAASLILETAPRVMAEIRAHMRAARSADLSVVQFRLLGFVARHEGVSLSEAAEHVGLALPAASKQVQGLVERGLLVREPGADRRTLALRATSEGGAEWRRCREATRRAIEKRLGRLTARELAQLHDALPLLARAFAPEVMA